MYRHDAEPGRLHLAQRGGDGFGEPRASDSGRSRRLGRHKHRRRVGAGGVVFGRRHLQRSRRPLCADVCAALLPRGAARAPGAGAVPPQGRPSGERRVGGDGAVPRVGGARALGRMCGGRARGVRAVMEVEELEIRLEELEIRLGGVGN